MPRFLDRGEHPRFTEGLPEVVKPVSRAIETISTLLNGDFPTLTLLEQYRPQDSWFLHPESKIHEAGHLGRALVLQELLSRLQINQQKDVDLDHEALRRSTAIHDVRRIDDGRDLEHGTRTAAWMREHMSSIVPPSTLDRMVYIVSWHVPQDHLAPEMTPELAILKDADGLDRVRLGDLNPAFLRHEYSRILLPTVAEELYLLSSTIAQERRILPFDAALAAGLELGIISAR